MGLVAWGEKTSQGDQPVPPTVVNRGIPEKKFTSYLLDPSAARREHPVLYLVLVIKITKIDGHVRECPVLQLHVEHMMPVAHLFGVREGVIIGIAVERLIRAEARIFYFNRPVRVGIIGREAELIRYYGIDRGYADRICPVLCHCRPLLSCLVPVKTGGDPCVLVEGNPPLGLLYDFPGVKQAQLEP